MLDFSHALVSNVIYARLNLIQLPLRFSQSSIASLDSSDGADSPWDISTDKSSPPYGYSGKAVIRTSSFAVLHYCIELANSR
jgi:hypothetical protein